jgi:hypothetical protein
MRWRALNAAEITALLFAIAIGGLIWYGGSITESHHVNFGACGGRGSMCVPTTDSDK